MKKLSLVRIQSLLLLLLITTCVYSCSGNNDEEYATEQQNDMVLEQKFSDTSWKLSKRIYIQSNGNERIVNDKYVNSVVTFSSEKYGIYNGVNMSSANSVFVNEQKSGCWWIARGKLMVQWLLGDAKKNGEYSMIFGFTWYDDYLIEHTSTSISFSNDKQYEFWYYTRCNTPVINNPDTGYEKPEIGFYDFTATKTTLKVRYKLYNKEKAGVTGAKIYYGTNSNPTMSKTATISGVLVTADISGLKSGTTYYVKCTATGKGGTTTTSTAKCITNY